MKLLQTGTLAGFALAAMMFSAPSLAQDKPATDTVATSNGDLVIRAIHHAATLLTWNGMTILVDPAPRPGGGGGGDVTVEYTALAAPDLILVTHEHGDHFNVDILSAVAGDGVPIVAPQSVADKMPASLQAKTTIMANGDTQTIKGIAIEAVPAYNLTPDRLKFHPKGRDNGYILSLGDKRVYFAADTEDTPEMRALKSIDVAFLPMNLPYTMTIEQAASAVKAFKPGIVYPYHYGSSDVEAFKSMAADTSDVRLLKWY